MKRNILIISILVMMLASIPVLNESFAEEQQFKWRMRTYSPFTVYEAKRSIEFAEKVNKRTNGKLKIEVYPPGTFGYSGFEMHRVVGDGLLEMGTMISTGVTEVEILEVFSHFVIDNPVQAQKAWDISKNEINMEIEKNLGVHTLGAYTGASVGWISKVKIEKFDDFKGKKLRAWNPLLTEWVKRVGGSPLVIPYNELYTSLAAGIIQGNASGAKIALNLKLNEVCDYYCAWPQQLVFWFDIVNKKAYDKLPQDIQMILMEEAKSAAEDKWKFYLDIDKTQEKLIAEKGVEIIRPSKEELKKAEKIENDIFNEWFSEQNEKNKEVMKKILEAIK